MSNFLRGKDGSENTKNNAIFANIQMAAHCTLLYILWDAIIPDKDIMSELKNDWPDQHAYVTNNLQYYMISMIGWGVVTVVGCAVYEIGICLAVPLMLWYLYIIIWNFCNHSVIYDPDWITAALKSDPATYWKPIHKMMNWMYWMRIVPLWFCGAFCCFSCILVCVTMAKNGFEEEEGLSRESVLEGEK